MEGIKYLVRLEGEKYNKLEFVFDSMSESYNFINCALRTSKDRTLKATIAIAREEMEGEENVDNK